MASRRPPSDKACAAGAVLGKHKKRVKGSGQYHVCLSPSQREALFGKAHIGKAIGCGTFACVFRRSDGRVVKLTKDREDIDGFIAAKGLDHVIRVDEIRELAQAGTDVRTKKPVPVYALIEERLRPWSRSEQKWIDKPLRKAGDALMKGAGRFKRSPESFRVSSENAAQIAREACSSASRKPEACRRFIGEFAETFAELFRRGVIFQDSHPGNFGVDKNGRWKILDLGYSGIKPRAVVDVLEGLQMRRRRR